MLACRIGRLGTPIQGLIGIVGHDQWRWRGLRGRVITKLGFFGNGDRLSFGLRSLLVPNGRGGAGERVVVQVL